MLFCEGHVTQKVRQVQFHLKVTLRVRFGVITFHLVTIPYDIQRILECLNALQIRSGHTWRPGIYTTSRFRNRALYTLKDLSFRPFKPSYTLYFCLFTEYMLVYEMPWILNGKNNVPTRPTKPWTMTVHLKTWKILGNCDLN